MLRAVVEDTAETERALWEAYRRERAAREGAGPPVDRDAEEDPGPPPLP